MPAAARPACRWCMSCMSTTTTRRSSPDRDWFACSMACRAIQPLASRSTTHNAFTADTGLDLWLRRRVEKIIISGIRTEQCCGTTARIGSDLGYAGGLRVASHAHLSDDACGRGTVFLRRRDRDPAPSWCCRAASRASSTSMPAWHRSKQDSPCPQPCVPGCRAGPAGHRGLGNQLCRHQGRGRRRAALLLGALRFLLAAFPALLFFRPPRVPLRWYLAYGLTISVGQFAFLFSAIHVGMPSGLASLVLQSQSFFTLLLAAWWLREPWRGQGRRPAAGRLGPWR